MTHQTFLVEIGTEELPPKSLRSLVESFAFYLTQELNKAHLDHGEVTWFATPRRLAVKVACLSTIQKDQKIEKRGPAIAQAYDVDGNPTKAATAWARSCGISLDQAKSLVTDKGEWLLYSSVLPGKSASSLLAEKVKIALSQLPISKLMSWGIHEAKFVRPVHTVTLLLGDELISGIIFGVNSNRKILGHRFMGEPSFIIEHADQYPQILLEKGKVMADFFLRKTQIKTDIEKAAEKIGAIADISDNLLEEVTSLVEWPVVHTAQFEKKFLEVPSEALVHTMKNDQKYFPVYNKSGQLMPYFIFVANILSQDPPQLIFGNEKVIRPRFADAQFFFETDLKQSLEERLPSLKTILFQKELGTLYEKVQRVQALSGWIASQIGANVEYSIKAGLLSKSDLMTNMVCEFPETQGIMGMHYARYHHEPDEVARAIYEQYQPRFSGDNLPSTLVACSVAIADKMDTLTGIFGINQLPKGDKDPFGLRRAALGVLRIIVEKNLPLDLQTLISEAVRLYGNKLKNSNLIDQIIEFMLGRFRSWYQEAGHGIDSIQAVLARRPTKPADFNARIQAVTYFRTMNEARALCASNKRVSNILSQSLDIPKNSIDTGLLKEPAEIELAQNILELEKKLAPFFVAGLYKDALLELVALREPLDIFFKQVMVMVPDQDLRLNRLALLNKLRALFLRVADISFLQ